VTTHISCRECEFEALTDDTDEAVRMVDTHESTTGHRVEDECVDDGAKLVTDGGETVIACPECDSAEIRINNGGINTRTDQFADHVCEDCGTEFDADEAVEREPYHPGGMSEQTRQLLDADPDEIGKPMTDGGRDHSFPSDDLWSDYRDAEIGVGDVVVDLSRGVSLQVTSVATKHAGEHPDVRSDRTAEMFDVDDDELVFNCVFLPDGDDAVSPPTKTYAYPESRLLRYPVEDATPNERLQREWLTNLLEEIVVEADRLGEAHRESVLDVVAQAFGDNIADLAEEFAEAAGGESA